MSAHTPGKWYADLDGECANVRNEDGGLIAQCTSLRGWHGCGGRRSAGEVAANTRLVAASPSMHDLLSRAADLTLAGSPKREAWLAEVTKLLKEIEG